MNSFTPKYNLDLYDPDDKPNLNDQYDAAMRKIDTELFKQAGDIVTAETAVANLTNKVEGFDTDIAQNTADITQLKTDVATAQTTAENGVSAAHEANELAVQASSAAQAAQTTANEAQTTANEAQTAANNAQTTANNALAATAKLGGNALFIGNSFLQGQNAANYGIKDYIISSKVFENAYFFYKPSSSFDNYNLGGVSITNSTNFNSIVNEAAASNRFNNDDINYVIFISAMGDTRALCAHYQENGTASFNNVNSTIANAQSKFPNAKIYIYFAEQIRVRNAQASYSKYFPFLQMTTHKQFATSGAIYLGWGGWKRNLAAYSSQYYEADNYHPSQAGSVELGKNLINALFGKLDISKCSEFSAAHIGLSNTFYTAGYVSNDPYNLNFSIPAIPNNKFPTKTNTGTFTQITDVVLGESASSTPLPILCIAPQWAIISYSTSTGRKTAPIYIRPYFDKPSAKIGIEYQIVADASDMTESESAIISLSNSINNLKDLVP